SRPDGHRVASRRGRGGCRRTCRDGDRLQRVETALRHDELVGHRLGRRGGLHHALRPFYPRGSWRRFLCRLRCGDFGMRQWGNGAMSKSTWLLVVVTMSVVLLSSRTVPAQQPAAISPSLFGEMRWRAIGPSRGGRTKSAAGHASQPFTFYIGVCNGGVWK